MDGELINNLATIVGIIVAMLGAFLFAFWVAMGLWTFNDIRSRSRDWLIILLACVLVMVFPIVGLVLYLMIRPKDTLAEVYDRALEEEALLRELEETMACHTCGVPVKENWVYCPNCHNQLQHSCVACGKLVRNEWEICVFCGAEQQASVVQPAPMPMRRPAANPLFRSERPSTAEADETLAYRPVHIAE
jgi:RNA polymerase subunit RPABC4/transcription elongation factor Spt4